MSYLNDLVDNTNVLRGKNERSLPAKPQAVIIVGSSGAGKTTLVNFIKNETDLVEKGIVTVPKRFITREKRDGDDLDENKHVTWDVFLAGTMDGTIPVFWERNLGGEKKERYGFESVPDSSSITLYSANNAMVEPGSGLSPTNLLENALIIGLHVPDAERWERFSKDIITKETAQANIRKSDHADNVFKYADLIIRNNKGMLEQTGQSLERILRKLALNI